MTEGIRVASLGRAASEVESVTDPPSSASNGCVHEGWSLQRSPARNDASSMKQAPLLALRWRPRDSTGSRSGAVLSLSGTGTPQVIDRPCIHYAPPRAIAPQTAAHLFADRAEGPGRRPRTPQQPPHMALSGPRLLSQPPYGPGATDAVRRSRKAADVPS